MGESHPLVSGHIPGSTIIPSGILGGLHMVQEIKIGSARGWQGQCSSLPDCVISPGSRETISKFPDPGMKWGDDTLHAQNPFPPASSVKWATARLVQPARCPPSSPICSAPPLGPLLHPPTLGCSWGAVLCSPHLIPCPAAPLIQANRRASRKKKIKKQERFPERKVLASQSVFSKNKSPD